MADGLEVLAAEAREALGGRTAGFVVGGAVRDRLLGRPVVDWDILVPGDAREAAVGHARRQGGSPFPLSERHGAWRVDDGVRMAVRDAHLAPRVAGERLFAELYRLLTQADPASGLTLADRLGVLAAVLPEVAALKGVEQNPYHHLDVFTHTLHVVDCTA